MFKAGLEPMAETAEELRKAAEQLSRCAEEIIQTGSALHELSYMEDLMRQMNKEVEKLNREASQTMQMGRALGNIAEWYRRSDREAGDFCEEARRIRLREPAKYYRLDWLNDWLNMEIS